MRLKVLLCMLWAASAPPHDVTYPARTWAALLGLDDPEGNGARRCRAAMRWLEDHQFVRTVPNPGQPNTLVLLDESGSNEPYQVPGAVMQARKDQGLAYDDHDYYVRIAPTFWTNGWIAELSGPAVAALLLTLDAASRQNYSLKSGTEVWFGGRAAKQRYDLSEDLRTIGLRELVEHEILTLRRRRVQNTVDFRRTRYAYVLNLGRLDERPVTAPLAVVNWDDHVEQF